MIRTEYKNKRITALLNIQDYRKCDELKEVTALKHQRRLLEAEKRSVSTSMRTPSRSSPPFLSPNSSDAHVSSTVSDSCPPPDVHENSTVSDSCPPPDVHENSTVSDSCPPSDVHENSTVSHSSPPLNPDNPPHSTCENLSMTLFSDPETVHSSDDDKYKSTTVGRPVCELVEIFVQNMKQTPSEYTIVNCNIYLSKSIGLTLQEYCIARNHYCKEKHFPQHTKQVSPLSTRNCDCNAMIQAAEMILREGIITLSSVFKAIFPNVTYHSHNAKSRLLAMPVVAMRLMGELYVMEKNDNLDYPALLAFLNTKLSQSKAQRGFSKHELKQLLSIAQSEREKECIRYAVYKAPSITPSQARRQFGLESMRTHALRVETCIQEAQEIQVAVAELASDQDKAILDTFGVCGNELSSPESDECSSEGSDVDASDTIEQCTTTLPDDQHLIELLRMGEYNWFDFVERLEHLYNDVDCGLVEKFFLRLPRMELAESSLHATVQSHRAFMAARRDTYEQDRVARNINGEIVTESEASCEEETNIASETKQSIVRKKRLSVKRRAQRLKCRLLVESRFLQCKVSKRTSKILTQCPNVGQVIEDFVQECNVGAALAF